MTVYRQWFCDCNGTLHELEPDAHLEEDAAEPACPRCGATPSSDPKHTIRYVDRENYSD